MAEPIPLNLPPRDPREALYRRLENAPREHAEALLNACEILQGLHDKGVLDLCKGAIGSGEKLLHILVEAGNSPEAIRGIRNLMILAKIADSIDPELLEGLAQAVPKAVAEVRNPKPPGFFQLLGKLTGSNARRALSAMTCLLEAFGKKSESEKRE